MPSYKKEGENLIQDFINFQKETAKKLDDLSRYVTEVYPNKAASNLNPLEAEIERFITLYEAKEYQFRKRLVALYKRYKHLADFNTIVKDQESDLKKLLDQNKAKQRDIHNEILARKYNVDPNILIRFLEVNLDFDAVKAGYQGLAKDPKIESEVSTQEKLIAALTKIISSY